MIWIAFGVGLCLGTFIGVLTVGLCQMAGRSDKLKDLRWGGYGEGKALAHRASLAETAK